MQASGKHSIGGVILVSGAAILLLSRIYWLFAFPGVMTPLHSVVSFLFGNWLASIVAPVGIDGYDMSFRVESLFWLPWSAIVIGFLVWGAIKAIQEKLTRNISISMLVIGIWMALGFVYDKIVWGLSYLSEDVPFALTATLSDLGAIVMFIGIGIIFVDQKKSIGRELRGGVVAEN